MSINWVMLHDTEGFVRLPGERTLYTSPPRTSLSLSTPNTYPGSQPFSASSSAGCVHLTNQRIVYLPFSPTPELNSFSAPILNLHDTHVSAPFFGPNLWRAALQVVGGGNIPSKSLVEVKMTFRDGGAFDFHSHFERIKERLQQAVEVARNNGQLSGDGSEHAAGRGGGALAAVNMDNVHLEQLPAYEEAGNESPVSGPTLVQTSSRNGPVTRDSGLGVSSDEEPTHAPESADDSANDTVSPPMEPPPGYEEVQRESVAIEVERRLQE
ncbi:MAG: hypothetical protein M1833_004535 [Piccolia ochrophora]|nr:MAG: hypothetical protein M1833_004535 [Piccolia ochrophora]